MKIDITEEQGIELKELEYSSGESYEIDGHKYTFADREYEVEDHRWNTTDRLIFKREDGKLFGMLYDVGKTETQESGFYYNTPKLTEVEKQTETITREYYEEVHETN